MTDKKQTKEYGVYHWDTFDNVALFLVDFDSVNEAMDYIEEAYKGRIRDNGADKVDIVTLSTRSIVKQYPVG